jgi:hypothetical protein
VTWSAQTNWHASTGIAEIHAIVDQTLSVLWPTTGQSAGAGQVMKATHKLDVLRVSLDFEFL